ncbi:UNVERIFIED_CONTAM: Retrovirus-related Pol polyprotein from transposon TNT 1-94 [Sesamum radiatum]|uniref:Retrovirus-related Pol polyprotein from transposon TNT 1-94 n=1 Tax=Sesamum radiatum TaxID=300843 RepID=A0AAW2VPJ7_SESRA
MSGAKFEVVKFDRTWNFGMWQTRVKDLLAQQGILKVLRPQKPASIDDEDWEEFQQCAAGTIRLCLVDVIMYHVMNLKSPGEVCKKLEIQFMSKSIKNKMFLKQRLYGLKMQEGFNLAQHVNVFNRIITDFKRLDVSIEDEDGQETIKNDNLDYNDRDMLSVSTNQFVDAWILDSECSYHITPNREWFTSYKSGNSDSVYLGDDRCCSIVGVGDVRIKMYDGTVRTLCDVRHIPDLKKNLISLRTFHKNGFIPKADEDRKIIRIVKGTLTVRPTRESSLGGSLYYVTSTDDFSRKVWVYFLKQKSKVFAKFKLRKVEVENQTGRKIKFLRSDNGTEYTNSQFQKFHKEHGIQRHFSVRKTPQQNGVVERINRSLTEKARCLRLNAGLPKSFWAEAVSMACYLINRSPRASLGGKVAEEVWIGNPINFDHLRIFGCLTYVHVPSDERSKLNPKSKQFIFLGYKKGVKGYKFWDSVARQMVISRDAVFDEQFML